VILDLTSLTTELLTKLLKKPKLLIGLDLKLILKPKEKVSSQRELPSNLLLKPTRELFKNQKKLLNITKLNTNKPTTTGTTKTNNVKPSQDNTFSLPKPELEKLILLPDSLNISKLNLRD